MNRDIFLNLKYFSQLIKKKACSNAPAVKISSTQMMIVDYLLSHGDVTQRELEGYLKASRATISDVIKTMEKNGIVLKKACVVDSRMNLITLTDLAKDKINEFKDKFMTIQDNALDGITDEELSIFNDVVKKMINNLERNDK